MRRQVSAAENVRHSRFLAAHIIEGNPDSGENLFSILPRMKRRTGGPRLNVEFPEKMEGTCNQYSSCTKKGNRGRGGRSRHFGKGRNHFKGPVPRIGRAEGN